jgi:hypothetical protein
LRDALADLFDQGRMYATLAVRALLAGTTMDKEAELAAARSATVGATHRAEDVFSQFLTEVGPHRVPLAVWGDLLTSGLRLWYATDTILVRAPGDTTRPPKVCPNLAGFLEQASDQFDGAFARAAAALRAGEAVTVEAPLPPDAVTGPLTSECIASLRGETDRERLERFMLLIEVRAALRVLSEDLEGLPSPVGEVAADLGPAR